MTEIASEQQWTSLAKRVILTGFEGLHIPGTLLDDAGRGDLGGLVLFKRNVENARQVADMVGQLKMVLPSTRGCPIAVDQEGGRVQRIGLPLTHLPPARRVAEYGDDTLTQAAGRLIGRELRALGITVNFAPVLDIDTQPDSPVIGDRAFAKNAQGVINHGLSFARGLREGGVFPCGKHFPGHGDATVDSHLDLPEVHHDALRLDAVEMVPFREYARNRLGPVMTAHIRYPALDASGPATVSRVIIQDILQKRLGFDGPVLTDDLEMGAISRYGGAAHMAVDIIRAGAHGLLICSDLTMRAQVVDVLAREAQADAAFAHRLQTAATQIETLGHPPGKDVPFSYLGSQVHHAHVHEVMSRMGTP